MQKGYFFQLIQLNPIGQPTDKSTGKRKSTDME